MTLPTIASVAEILRTKRASSVELTKAVIEAAREAGRLSPNRNPFVAIDEKLALADAAQADRRIAAGETRGPLDGVPIAIKDEIDVAGLPTRKGTSYLPDVPLTHDAHLTAGLRGAGAVIVGKLDQHENGLGATGINMQSPVPRNPHDVSRAPGGSSSGSAVAVAAGLVPMAVGADGGGSIRIPSSLCGVFGIKPTLGRTSRHGTGFDQGTLAVAGPLASSVADIDLFLRLTSSIDPRDRAMEGAPELDLEAMDRARDAFGKKLRVGVPSGEIGDADEPVARAVQQALSSKSIELVEVRIPSIHLARGVGYITFGVEASAALRKDLSTHRHRMGLDIRLLMSLGERIAGRDFLHAQRLRQRLRREVNEVLGQVDLLALPSTACTAPPVRPGAESTGEIDDAGTAKLARYTFLGNLTGLPAASVPIGTDEAGLPIGLQLIGAAFDEPTVLRAMYALEREGIAACPVARHRVRVFP